MPDVDNHMPYVVRWDGRDQEWKIILGGTVGIAVETFDNKSDAVDRANRLAINNRRPGVVVYDRQSVEKGESVFGEAQRFIPHTGY